ncbi:HTH-type transcriptional repressor KstR2 [Rubrobacter xylanophilus DSM 9941]|uniref:TetR/AcrR family transcriptional regulator n=1 Tax=Rubrobacter xylanophilus TaxID=49319 RepID=UPI001C63DBBE|nr:TetR/AcrR family transcriptional regulator [Rubrobacter xylanophilus]QYJ16596.1 HTH-type transcriptional repressor KstR2 [Rubrobacter xylanophilus DSM 9941]
MAERFDSTSARLHAAAAGLFWNKGYAATTTRELAAVLGLQKASLYHHMESKEELLYDICVESLGNIRSAVEAAVEGVEDPLERVRALIRAHVVSMLMDKEKHATMLTEMRSLSEKRRREVIRLRDEYERLVRSVLAEAQEAGVLRDDLSAKQLALCLLNLMNWAIFWFRSGEELSPERLAEVFTTLFLEGAGTGGEASPEGRGGTR